MAPGPTIFSLIIVSDWNSLTATCLLTATMWSGFSANRSAPKLPPEQHCFYRSYIVHRSSVSSGNKTQTSRYHSRLPSYKRTTTGLE